MDEVTQIKIGKHTVGLVGFKEALSDMAEAYAERPDDMVAEELLNRLSKKNYIDDKVKKDYRRAFVREFRKSLGQPFDDENPEGLEIKILGEGCAICNSLENGVREVLSEMSLGADLEHVRDAEQISKYKFESPFCFCASVYAVSMIKPPVKCTGKGQQRLNPCGSTGRMPPPACKNSAPSNARHFGYSDRRQPSPTGHLTVRLYRL